MGNSGVSVIGASASRRRTLSQSAHTEGPAEEHRALVPVAQPIMEAEADEHLPLFSYRPAAPFLAHLIATAQSAPQTRDHRRAAPDVAAQAYEATSGQMHGLVVRENQISS